MDSVKKLLEENQWSRPSPSLRIPKTNERAPTCPICTSLEKYGHDKECWLGQAISGLEQEVQSAKEQVSWIQGLKVNRDSLLEENRRFRVLIAAKGKQLAELREENEQFRSDVTKLSNQLTDRNITIRELQERTERAVTKITEAEAECVRVVGTCDQALTKLKEFRSMHEGKMDAASEVITRLELKVNRSKEAKKGLRIELVQQSGKIYFWALMLDAVQLAHSRNIDYKKILEPEADKIAAALGLPVVVNERK